MRTLSRLFCWIDVQRFCSVVAPRLELVLKFVPGVETPGYFRVVAPRLHRAFWIFAVCVIPAIGFCGSSFGQGLHREWIRTYSNLESKVNQANAIAVAPDGNIVVAGSSQNAEGDLDYQVIKYNQNGDEVWRARYGSDAQGNDQFRGMTIDPKGNVIVTGTSATVKFNSDGGLMWAAPLPGRAVIANSDYVYVTGFSETDISTAQLQNNSVDGKENWRRLVDGAEHGIDIGQAITLDKNGNVYVAGQEAVSCNNFICHRVFGVVSYTPQGAQRWHTNTLSGQLSSSAQVGSVLVHPDGSVYVWGSYDPQQSFYGCFAKFDPNGRLTWFDFFDSVGTRMIVDHSTGNLMIAGRKSTQGTTFPQAATVVEYTFVPTTNATYIWSYAGPVGYVSEASDIAQDSRRNIYVTGYSANDATSSAQLVAKLTAAGQQIGFDRFNTTNAISNVGAALTVDARDNVYVTGYAVNAQGGSEFVTIKYSDAPKVEQKQDGVVHLEFYISPGQSYAIEATTNFLNWQGVITNSADANGLIQFDDTNAVAIPYRFYRGRQ